MEDTQGQVIVALMEQMIANGPDGLAGTFTALFNLAMKMERDAHLGAGLYERCRPRRHSVPEDRRGYANGDKPKTLDTQAGTVTVQIPKSQGHDEPFFPHSLERGRRSPCAVLLAIAEMYVQGVSTRDMANNRPPLHQYGGPG
jgi:transposase-like protein